MLHIVLLFMTLMLSIATHSIDVLDGFSTSPPDDSTMLNTLQSNDNSSNDNSTAPRGQQEQESNPNDRPIGF
jgi:hypothetical protein